MLISCPETSDSAAGDGRDEARGGQPCWVPHSEDPGGHGCPAACWGGGLRPGQQERKPHPSSGGEAWCHVMPVGHDHAV